MIKSIISSFQVSTYCPSRRVVIFLARRSRTLYDETVVGELSGVHTCDAMSSSKSARYRSRL